MIMMMMMMMTMMTNTIPYRRTKIHIWDKVLMGIWVHPVMTVIVKKDPVMKSRSKNLLICQTVQWLE